MDAGYGAEEQATRRGRRIERLRREQAAAGETDSAVAAALEAELRRQRAWSAGAEGERMVAKTIGALEQYGWTALHDVHWPGRPQANIDHIAIGPGGVVVIDAKNWSGDVRVADGVLRQNGYRRDREVSSVAQATAAVTALLAPAHRAAVLSVICLAGQDQAPVRLTEGVTVVGRPALGTMLATMPARLTPYDVADLGRHLAATLGGPRSPALATTADLNRPRGGSRGWSGGRSGRSKTSRSRRSAQRPPSAEPYVGTQRLPRTPRRRRSAGSAILRIALLVAVSLLFINNASAIGTWVGERAGSSLTTTP